MRNIMDYWRAYKSVSYHQTMGFFTFCWKMYKGHKVIIDRETFEQEEHKDNTKFVDIYNRRAD